MNAEEKGKITQNLTYLKDRMVELDSVIDRLIEKGVFRFEHRGQIEGISKPTPHRQFNEFIKILVSSPCRDAYQIYVEALKEEGYGHLAQKLEKTHHKDNHKRHGLLENGRSTSRASGKEEYSPLEEVGAAGTQTRTDNGCSDCASTVKSMLEVFGKQQQNLLLNLDRQRREDISELERKRLEDKNSNQEQISQLWRQWQSEKQELLLSNEQKISNLQTQIKEFQKGSEEFIFLKEKYDHLRQQQKGMKEKDEERCARMEKLAEEKRDLEVKNQGLHKQLKGIKDSLHETEEYKVSLEEDNSRSEEYITKLEEKVLELEAEISRIDRQNKELKNQVDKQYKDMQAVLLQQRETPKNEDLEFVQTVEQQNKKLDAIYGMMKTMSLDKEKKCKQPIQNGKKVGPKVNYTTATRENR